MLERFEHYPLAFGPTHIEKLARLSEHGGGEVEIYARREDCNSELPFGGNKLRKLEHIIPDAVASSADTLVSIDGAQSNHTRMVAAFAAKIGMKCRPVQENRVPHGDAVHDRIGNILFLSSSIAKASPDQAAMARTLQQPRRGVRRDGKSLQSPLRGAAP